MMDHFYQGIHGCFTFHSFYRWVASRAREWWHGVEVGCLHGQSAAYLAVELINNGSRGCKLDLVDKDQSESDVRSNLARVEWVIGRFHRESSWDAARHYLDETLDMVFLDADHEYESVKRDIAAWWPKVAAGGVLAGHDYEYRFPGVCRAVNEAFPNFELWRGSLWPDETVTDERKSIEKAYYPTWMVTK